MPFNMTEKLIKSHLVSGEMVAGEEIGLKIDQTLTQDATGTMVMLELEAMGLDRAKTEASAQYVDHNIIQPDSKNPDDHLFLQSAAQRFGLYYSRPGNGVSILFICNILQNQEKRCLALIAIHVPMGAWGCWQWGLVDSMSLWPLLVSLFIYGCLRYGV